MTLVDGARLFAQYAHGAIGQCRKYTDDPYIVHPAAVVGLLRQVTQDPHVLAAGWLHDVVEDTGVTLDTVRELFGDRVADMVDALTKRPGATPPQVEVQLHYASADAQTVKVADIIDNCLSIRIRDPDRAQRYLQLKRSQLEVMDKAHPALREVAWEICR